MSRSSSTRSPRADASMGEATPAWQFTISPPWSQRNKATTDTEINEGLLEFYLLVATPRETIDTGFGAGQLKPRRQRAETFLGARASPILSANAESEFAHSIGDARAPREKAT